MFSKSSRRLTLALAFLSLCPALEAATRFSESFDADSAELPAGWTLVSSLKTGGGASIAPFPGGEGVNSLLLQRPAGKSPENAVVWYTGSQDGAADGMLKDFSGSVILRHNKGPQSTRGIVVRAAKQEYVDFDGYYIALISEKGNEGIGIYRNPPNHLLPGEALAFTPVAENFHPERSYRLHFSVKGTVIEASVVVVDENGSELKPLASVTANNVSPEAGYFGLRGGYANSGPINTWFRSLNLEIE